jgi:hypothetical protein
MGRRFVATILMLSLSGVSLLGQTPSLGQVTQSSGAKLNSGAISVGTTVFDGDRLETIAKGALGFRSGSVQLFLPENSVLLMGHDESGLTPTLQRGSVTFRTEGGAGIRLGVGDIRVRPRSSAATAGQITLEQCAVVITSRAQTLEVTAGKETKIVEEGKSYRVLMQDSCNGPRNNTTNNASRPIMAGHSRFIAIPIGVAILTWIGVDEALESPDRP